MNKKCEICKGTGRLPFGQDPVWNDKDDIDECGEQMCSTCWGKGTK